MGDPLDKAGAYAVQAHASLFIEGIDGDFWNIAGLPINLVYEMVMNGERQELHPCFIRTKEKHLFSSTKRGVETLIIKVQKLQKLIDHP